MNLTTQSDLYDKYDITSINNMKRILKKLKHENANIDEIKFLSRLIRKMNKTSEDIEPKTLESDLHTTFWKTCRGYSTRQRIHCQHSPSNVALNIFERRLPAILVRCQVSKFLRGFRSYPTQSRRTTTLFLHTKKWQRRSGGREHRHPDQFSTSSRSSY